MIWLAILLFIVAFGLFVFTVFAEDKQPTAISGLIVGALSLIFGIWSCVGYVPTGNVGVPVLFGSVDTKTTIAEGLRFTNPFKHIEQMSIRTENYWMSHSHKEGDGADAVSIRSSNGLQMPVDLSVPYRLVPDSAGWVYQNLGRDYVNKLIRPAITTAARRAGSRFTDEELYSTKRDEFAALISTLLEEELHKLLQDGYKEQGVPKQVLILSPTLVGNIEVPQSIKESIEKKLAANQAQQAMEFEIMKAKKEAERKEVEAKGIQKFQSIVTQGISPELLQWKAIEATLELATSNNAKVVIIGGKDGLPVILNTNDEMKLGIKQEKK